MKFKKWILYSSITIALLILFIGISVLYYLFYIPKQYKREAESVAKEFGVDKALILAVMKVESNFRANAVSRVGAVGLMQIMPQTANFICQALQEDLDINNYQDNIKMGTWYLRYLQNKFIDTRTVLAAYNAGEGTVRKWLQQSSVTVDGQLKNIPYKETATYVQKVEKFYKQYQKMHI